MKGAGVPERAGRGLPGMPETRGEGGPAPALRVRPAALPDLEGVVRVELASFSTPWSAGSFQALLGRDQVLFLVLEGAPGRVMGHGILWWAGEEGEVANLAVAPECRGRGAGGVLLDRLLDGARNAGLESVFLEVRASNEAAAALYRTRGFRPVGVRRDYYSRPREDARVLRLDLPEREP